MLLATRHSACRAKVSAINQLKALIVGAPEELRAKLRGLASKRQITRCASLRDRPAQSLEHRMTVRGAALDRPPHPTAGRRGGRPVGRAGAAGGRGGAWLLELPGVGPISAAQVLVSWSHVGRLRSDAAFAALAGANPIPACSEQVTRHRLNRGVTASSTERCTRSCWPGCATTQRPGPTPPGGAARARASEISVGA